MATTVEISVAAVAGEVVGVCDPAVDDPAVVDPAVVDPADDAAATVVGTRVTVTADPVVGVLDVHPATKNTAQSAPRTTSLLVTWRAYVEACDNLGSQQRGEVPMRALVEKTIEVIRPALQADGGDIVLREVDEETGIVSVTLIGACGTCPASTQTLKAGIERIMKDRVDGVTEVINVE